MKHIELALQKRLEVAGPNLAMNRSQATQMANKDPDGAIKKLKAMKARLPALAKELETIKKRFDVSLGEMKLPSRDQDFYGWYQTKISWPKVKKLRSTDQREIKRVERALTDTAKSIGILVSAIKEAAKPKVPKPPVVLPSDEEMRKDEYKRLSGSYDARERKKALEWRWGADLVKRVKWGKYMGDDIYSYAVFVDGRPFATGLGQFSKNTTMTAAYKYLAKHMNRKDNLTGEIPE